MNFLFDKRKGEGVTSYCELLSMSLTDVKHVSRDQFTKVFKSELEHKTQKALKMGFKENWDIKSL